MIYNLLSVLKIIGGAGGGHPALPYPFNLQNCVNLSQVEFHIYFVFMSSYLKCNFYLLLVIILSLGLMF